MSSTTSMIATRYRLQEWAEQVRACQNRPDGMKVIDWCAQNNITKADYYYRLRKVREACLESMPKDMISTSIVPVPAEVMNPKSAPSTSTGLDISVNGFSIHVTEATSLDLLSTILQVISHAQ
ncbi:IS66 family insertion sequence element accessory protein TnpB [Lachnospiraceae bacterium MD1]|uniref:IS66 family insertion sequence element accessory protein TnpB n=1 Tax=Variimorphobacter saccharofermentans TaxID=2755051 RepID=A0A839K481_9FIRM|nr:IS66 family insertion sequence element accessory protein TnpB [Variimorphobacter saccharofermentans]MBB2183992.1 IS66 family insertion sequence element accessory protein TnpB [Variimorphobacter saccharofermentans]